MNKGFVCLGALTVLGDILLNLKFSGNLTNDIMGLLLTFTLCALSVIFLKFLSSKSKIAFPIFSLVPLVLLALFTVYSFASFAAPVMLGSRDILVPAVLLVGLALYLGGGNKKTLYKFSLISAMIAFTIIVFTFSFSLQFMSGKYFVPYTVSNANLIKNFVPLYLNLTASALPLLIVSKPQGKNLAAAYLLSFGVIGVAFANVIGIFGSEFASKINHPYLSAVSAASVGEIFSRLDGFFYAAAFVMALIRIAACIYAVKEVISVLTHKLKP